MKDAWRQLEGKVLDLSRPLTESGTLEVVTPAPSTRSSSTATPAHLCERSQAPLPGRQVGIGPAIENGYD